VTEGIMMLFNFMFLCAAVVHLGALVHYTSELWWWWWW